MNVRLVIILYAMLRIIFAARIDYCHERVPNKGIQGSCTWIKSYQFKPKNSPVDAQKNTAKHPATASMWIPLGMHNTLDASSDAAVFIA